MYTTMAAFTFLVSEGAGWNWSRIIRRINFLWQFRCPFSWQKQRVWFEYVSWYYFRCTSRINLEIYLHITLDVLLELTYLFYQNQKLAITCQAYLSLSVFPSFQTSSTIFFRSSFYWKRKQPTTQTYLYNPHTRMNRTRLAVYEQWQNKQLGCWATRAQSILSSSDSARTVCCWWANLSQVSVSTGSRAMVERVLFWFVSECSQAKTIQISFSQRSCN